MMKANIAFSLWALIAANIASTYVLKPAFKRLRPVEALPDVNFLVTMKRYGWAFPSTHTAMAAALVTVLWDEYKGLRWAMALFVVFIAWVSSLAKRHIARTLATLAGLPCPKCGAAYGSEAATQAREQFLARARDARLANPHLHIYFGHTWTVHCPHCGADTGFRDDTWTLQAGVA